MNDRSPASPSPNFALGDKRFSDKYNIEMRKGGTLL